jgi:hypothetical protein
MDKRRFNILVGVIFTLLLGVFSISAWAQLSATLSISPEAYKSPARVSLTLPVTYTCEIGEIGEDGYGYAYLDVAVYQASGRKIGRGYFSDYYDIGYPGGGLICDGTPQLLEADVLADPYDGTPWHGGKAEARGYLYVETYKYDPVIDDYVYSNAEARANQILKIRSGKK